MNDLDVSEALPNFDIDTLVVNKAEVAQMFHITLEELLDEKRLYQHRFRNGIPYWTVNVSDKVSQEYWTSPRLLPGETEDRGPRLEIWGITGWYLSLFLRRMRLW